MPHSTFTSAGVTIRVDVFPPRQPSPAVIALHGSGGIRDDSGQEYARLLAAQGFLVLVPHYFQRTGTTWAAPHMIEGLFPAWMETVAHALDYAAAHPKCSGKIGLLGFSLGAYLSLSVAAHDPRVAAVVDYFGGLPQPLVPKITRMPPVLILHGEADPIVPVAEAHKLQRLFDEKQLPYELKLYPKAGHGFHGPDMMDAAQRTLAFLNRHLR